MVCLGVLFWFAAGSRSSGQQPVFDEFDFSRLAHPEVADTLQLSDLQRTEVSRLVSEQAARLAGVAEGERDAVRREFSEKLRAQLTAEQLAKLAELPELRKLQFNFGSQNWEDVLRWFAKQADLSLVMSSAPEGAFNYTDSNEYTPAQAINLLNSILLTKGYTLVRRDKLLILVEISGGIPDELLPRVTMDELDRRGSFEIVSVMFSLGNKPAQTVMAEVKPILGSYGKLALLPQSNQLLVTETVGKIRAIDMLIQSVPSPVPPPEKVVEKAVPPVLESYPLGSLDYASTAETIQSIAAGAVVSGGVASQKIVVYAPPAQQALIRSLLEQLNSGTPLQEQVARLQIHQLDQPIDSKQLVEQIALVVPQAKVAFDATHRRLMVYANGAQQQQVAEILQQLDAVQITDAQSQVRLFQLRHADPSVASQMAAAISPRAQLSLDAATRTLVVRSSPGELEIIAQLVAQLDRPSAGGSGMELKSYDLPRGPHTEFLAVLQSLAPKAKLQVDDRAAKLLVISSPEDQLALEGLIRQYQANRAGTESARLQTFEVPSRLKTEFLALQAALPQEFGQYRLIPDENPNRLTAWGDPPQLAALAELLDQLKSGAADESQFVLKTYETQVEDVSNLMSVLRPQFPQARITASAANDRLLIWASPDEQVELALRLENLNRELPQRETPSLKFYPLDAGQSSLATGLLAQLVPAAKVQWDPASKQLSVITTAREHVRVAQALQELQAGVRPATLPELVVYPLPADLRSRFDAVFAALQTQLGDIRIVDDKRTGEVAVMAAPAQHVLIKEVIDQVTRPVAGVEPFELTAYPCGNSEPKPLVDFLTQLFPTAKIVADEAGLRVLVWAQPGTHQEIEKVLRQFLPETGPATGNPNRLQGYKLQNIKPSAALALVQQLVPKMQLVGNDEQGLLLAWGRELDHQRLSAALEQINLPNDPKRLAIQVYPTDSLDPQIAAAVLSRVMPDASIIPNQSGRLVAVLARGEQHQLVRQALEQMAGFVEGGGPQTVQSFRVERTGAAAAVAALTPIFPQAKFFSGANPMQLVVLANSDDHTSIRQTIDQLESEALAGAGLRLKVYQLRADLATQVRPLIQAALPSLKLVGTDPTVLAILARDSEHEQVQAILQQAEQQLVATPKKIAAYRLTTVSGIQARQALSQKLPQLAYVEMGEPDVLYLLATDDEHQAIGQLLEELQAVVAQRPQPMVATYPLPDLNLAQLIGLLPAELAAKATIKADPENEMLIVSAPAEVQAALKPVIEELQSRLPKVDQVVSRIYPLSGVAPRDWTTLLATLAPGAVVASDPNSGSLVVAARTQTHEKIQSLIEEFKTAVTQGKVARAYRISKADAQVTAEALSSLLPTAKVSVDKPSRTVLVVASEEDQATVAETVAQLDLNAPSAAVSAVYPVSSGDAAQLATALKTLLPAAAFVPDSTGRSLLVLASADEQEQARRTVEQWTQDPSRRMLTKVYPLAKADPVAAVPVLQKLLPGVTLSADAATRSLAATGTAEQHEAIATTIRELDSVTEAVETKIYPAGRLSARDWQALLTQLAPGAVSAVDPQTETLIVTARPPVQEQVEKLVNEFRQAATVGKAIRAFRLSQADPQVVGEAIGALSPQAKVTADKTSRSLLVVAPEADLEGIAATIEQIDRAATQETTSQIYPVASGDAGVLATALKNLVPGGTFVADPSGKTLLVIAAARDHETIRQTVTEWSADLRRTVSSQVFPLQRADPQTALAALQKLVPGATLAADSATRALLVTGTSDQLQLVGQALRQLDGIDAENGDKLLQSYPLASGDGKLLVETLSKLFERDRPTPQISFDPTGQQLLVLGSSKQHALVAQIVQRMVGETRQFEMFRLQTVDPVTAQTAINGLFSQEPRVQQPQIDLDYESSYLFVRATSSQLTRIRELLIQLGEPDPSLTAAQGGHRMQVIPLQTDSDRIVEQLRWLWPQLKSNELKVIEPQRQVPTPSPPSRKEDPPASEGAARRSLPLSYAVHRVSPATQERLQSSSPSTSPSPEQVAQTGDDPPIFVIPGNRQLTIASADPAAMQQLEQLIRALAGPAAEGGNSGNFETFSLQNAGASEVAALLTDLYEEMTAAKREFRTPVVITADDRLNLLIVHAGRSDREVIAELIEILDSPDLNEAFSINQPVIVPVKNTDAERILRILNSVYRSQLSSGGGRRQIPIPDGVSSDLASMLQQINASTSGPILTLGVDAITNSIIILAPPQLRDQVRATIEQLDRNVEIEPGEEIEIIQLQKTNPVRIQRALDLLFKENKK